MERFVLAGVVAATIAAVPAAAQYGGGYGGYGGGGYGSRYYDEEYDAPRRRPPPPPYGGAYGQQPGPYGRSGYGPPPQRLGSICVTARGNCPWRPSPINAPCGCNVPGFGFKRGAIGG